MQPAPPPRLREILLLRHAAAVDGVSNDFARILTEDGRLQAERAGRLLARHGLVPDLVVSSPAPRAWETAVLASRELGIPELRIVADRALYDAAPEEILEVLERHAGDWPRVMLVGHNPGLSEFCSLMTRKTGGAPLEMGKASVAHLRAQGTWHEAASGTAEWVGLLTA